MFEKLGNFVGKSFSIFSGSVCLIGAGAAVAAQIFTYAPLGGGFLLSVGAAALVGLFLIWSGMNR